MSTAHITTPPRHPLVDAWIDAGMLVDATYHALYDGTAYAKPYHSFADAFSTRMDEIEQHNIVDETMVWLRSVEQNCRVALTKQVVVNLCNHVAKLASAAAQAILLDAGSTTPSAGELYRIYLNNFIEYLTPSLKLGKMVDGHVVDPYVVRSRHGTHTDVNMLRAQAQGIVDAGMAQGVTEMAKKLPRTLDGFCEHLGVVRK